METLKWGKFKQQLNANTELILQFQYGEGKWVNAAYHITEVKQAPITSVDCGGAMNAWTEIIIQLYEPLNEQKDQAMKVSKALSIINVVEKALPLHPDAIVKIEFGNSNFDTRQMLPQSFLINGNDLIVDLRADTVQCKANERGGSCGSPANNAEPKIQLQNLAVPAAACDPGGSGCC